MFWEGADGFPCLLRSVMLTFCGWLLQIFDVLFGGLFWRVLGKEAGEALEYRGCAAVFGPSGGIGTGVVALELCGDAGAELQRLSCAVMLYHAANARAVGCGCAGGNALADDTRRRGEFWIEGDYLWTRARGCAQR